MPKFNSPVFLLVLVAFAGTDILKTQRYASVMETNAPKTCFVKCQAPYSESRMYTVLLGFVESVLTVTQKHLKN